ncbi:MAG: redoxin domain-containing protein [Tunicatimonas sp.]
MRYLLLSFILVMTSLTLSFAQRSDYVEDFKLSNLVSGNEFSLKDYSAPTVVVIFTSLHCPYAQLYDQRITNLINDFESDQIRFVLINPTNPANHPQDASDNLKKAIEANQWKVPFLIDPSQRIARLLGAEKTPEVFVLSRQRNSFKMVYQGAIDDNPQVANDVHHNYLRDFLKAQRTDQTAPVRTTPATGCRIKS